MTIEPVASIQLAVAGDSLCPTMLFIDNVELGQRLGFNLTIEEMRKHAASGNLEMQNYCILALEIIRLRQKCGEALA